MILYIYIYILHWCHNINIVLFFTRSLILFCPFGDFYINIWIKCVYVYIYIYTYVYTHHMGICAKWWSQCVSLKNQTWIFSHESHEVAARKYAPRVLYACAGICICICMYIYIYIYICTLIYIHMYINLHCKSEHAPFDLLQNWIFPSLHRSSPVLWASVGGSSASGTSISGLSCRDNTT